MSNGELILYTSEDGAARIQLRAEGGTVWLSLAQIADLFGRDKSLISRHIKAIFAKASWHRIQLLHVMQQLPPTARPTS